MELTYQNRTALVTGASQGIGRASALALARSGVRVIGAARRTEMIDALSEESIASGGQPIVSLSFDMSLTGTSRLLATQAEHLAGGAIDILVNAAGASRPIALESPDEEWRDAMQIGFFAARELTHALLPKMRMKGWGRVITITGTSEPQFLSASTPAKAALHVWSKGVSLEVAQDGVTMNCIQPGRIRSEQLMRKFPTPDHEKEYAKNLPMGRLGEAEELAAAVLFLASAEAAYISGTVLPVDGSFRRFAF
ncbi:3-oxoacyl-ACP reductase [Sphingobium sp. SCG-1]|uniref:SDR family NAD(P)-dependent oxidoreductase n=1 Tax=Sphingobium sp. SCG-1 TaxID=2072936 RepID=UPI000CD686BB|nr:SDR family oxidoreductase [Sphingobium sp. SCG-1]AUW56999.1 3-oxoacyl-ACP reductase [Sphingobium sp. SCG-1]